MKKLILLFLLSSNCFAAAWQCLDDRGIVCSFSRLNVPTGWVVKYSGFREYSITFVPDPEHKWKV